LHSVDASQSVPDVTRRINEIVCAAL